MSQYHFLEAVRSARAPLFGRLLEGAAAGPTCDRIGMLSAAAHSADVWLTPDLVKDYDEAEFGFLMQDERIALSRAVNEFRHLAKNLQGNQPTAGDIERGVDLFLRIHAILAPHIEEPDLQRIAEATRSVQWPEYVLWVDYRLGTDSTGDPAVWIWLGLKDDVEIESPAVQAELARVREAYRNAIQQAGINRWPYIRVRTRSEMKEQLTRGAASACMKNFSMSLVI